MKLFHTIQNRINSLRSTANYLALIDGRNGLKKIIFRRNDKNHTARTQSKYSEQCVFKDGFTRNLNILLGFFGLHPDPEACRGYND